MGPLKGVRIIEFAGIGPGPFCAMMLADMGAGVLRIVRPEGMAFPNPRLDLLNRGRRSIRCDLKNPDGVALVLDLLDKADGLVEGFRPGVMERMGLGSAVCLERNPRLVYGRMTGWGQDGPLAKAAGHDINYIALAGALDPIGRRGQQPTPPLNLVGDFGGGGLLLAYGIVCALLERERSGKGQVVDAAMVDGAALLMTFFHGMSQAGFWNEERGTNVLDTGAHFYDVYETMDGKYVSIGSVEPQFYAELVRLTGLEHEPLPSQWDQDAWPQMKERFVRLFRTKTCEEWCALLEGTDACFAPVLPMIEARHHPHNRARGTFAEIDGVSQARPAPRFSRTEPEIPDLPAGPGGHLEETLRSWGIAAEVISRLESSKVIT